MGAETLADTRRRCSQPFMGPTRATAWASGTPSARPTSAARHSVVPGGGRPGPGEGGSRRSRPTRGGGRLRRPDSFAQPDYTAEVLGAQRARRRGPHHVRDIATVTGSPVRPPPELPADPVGHPQHAARDVSPTRPTLTAAQLLPRPSLRLAQAWRLPAGHEPVPAEGPLGELAARAT